MLERKRLGGERLRERVVTWIKSCWREKKSELVRIARERDEDRETMEKTRREGSERRAEREWG